MTGPPGVGKTTLIRKVAAELARLHPVGFYTAEIRERGARKGFELLSLAGRRGVLSHVDIRGPHRVGKYGVNVGGFEEFLDSIPWASSETGLVVIDEIGKMECFSEKFREVVRRALDSAVPLVATIARHGSGLIAEVKARSDVELVELTANTRDSLVGEIVKRLA